MYYKIENKECEVYKQLHELRTRELVINKMNKALIATKVNLDYDKFMGNINQGWVRTWTYSGFLFKESEKVNPKIWKLKDGCYYPNSRTKDGKDMSKFLSQLDKTMFKDVLEILDIELGYKFSFPFLDLSESGVVVLYLSDNHVPKDENLIEITSKEFEALRVS